MDIGLTIVLSFGMIGLGVLTAALWSVWFPKTRCQKTRKDVDTQYNICIRVKSHDGPHMGANGERF